VHYLGGLTVARVQSKNELAVIASINLIEYYNKNIVPVGAKFKPMSDSQNTGLCPFHVDTDPSLHMWKKKNIFHCFGCGFGGDVVKTHMQIRRQYYGEKMSVDKAVELLAAMYDIPLDKETGFVVKSVFDRAKEVMFEKETYTIPKDVLSISGFRQLNNKIKRSNVTMQIKIDNFENLDRTASSMLSNSK
jgi:DNA primase